MRSECCVVCCVRFACPVTVNVDVTGAVEACLNLGYAQADIIVDVIECGAVNMSTLSGDPSTLTVLPVLLRASTMRSFGSSQRDYEAAVNAYPQVNFRYRIAPSQGISGTGIDFNHTQMVHTQHAHRRRTPRVPAVRVWLCCARF